MSHKRKIKLGFSEQEFQEGAHICQIFSTDEEREKVLVDYIISGLKQKEKIACFSENSTRESLVKSFNGFQVNYERAVETGEFSLSKTNDVYFTDNVFEPQTMLSLLKSFHNTALLEEYAGARVIGEMVPEIEHIKGGNQLLEYECLVSVLLKEFPVTAVCQYDARLFDGATIMDVLKVHPYMIVRGMVVTNPFFIKPEEYLAKRNN